MIELKQYRKLCNCFVVAKIDDGKLISFGVADKNMELVTSESFKTANDAFEWASGYRGLCYGE